VRLGGDLSNLASKYSRLIVLSLTQNALKFHSRCCATELTKGFIFSYFELGKGGMFLGL